MNKIIKLYKEDIKKELHQIVNNPKEEKYCLDCIENYLCQSTCPMYYSCCAHGASWLMVEDYSIED